MKKTLRFLIVVLVLLSVLLFNPAPSFAYIDYSYHRIETGAFLGEETVKSALQKLRSYTGWWATYEAVGKPVPYYKVYSGGFYGKENVESVLNQFIHSTGLSAKYIPLGNPEPYKKVVTGGIYGRENVKHYLKEFSNSTGLTASFEPVGEEVFKKRIVSGAFLGENNVKQVMEQFQKQTGISAVYKPTGQYEEYKQVVSGGFYGEENVRAVLQNFMASTGLKASYEPLSYSEFFTIISGGFYGETNVKAIIAQLNNDFGISADYSPGNNPDIFYITTQPLNGDLLLKVNRFLENKGWWYRNKPTGQKIPITFRIRSEQIIDKELINKALNFYKKNNWWATTVLTGNKVYNKFYIQSGPITDSQKINKGMRFFTDSGWWVTTENSDEKTHLYFRIVTAPLLGKDKLNRAIKFFKEKNWWYAEVSLNEKGYTTFQIVTDPLLGETLRDKALKFFNDRNWWASSVFTGKNERYYKIVTGSFLGYENALSNAKMISDHFGWWTTTILVKNGPRVMYTNYNLTLEEMANLQMKLLTPPQTDRFRNEPVYIHSDYVDLDKNIIIGTGVNVRKGPGIDYESVAKLNSDFKDFTITGRIGEWIEVLLTWKNAPYEDVMYYLNPQNFPPGSSQFLQFLKLSIPTEIDINEVNEKILNDTAGALKGTASAFAEAAKLYGINELYLIGHALHETGYGTSPLAEGVIYNGKKVYNVYGYNAFDHCPIECGAKKAYEEGWTSIEKAIIGGAKLIRENYIYNPVFPQDTLYKMRWNPIQPWHQYATDVGWAVKQTVQLYKYYQLLENYTLYFDIPEYN